MQLTCEAIKLLIVYKFPARLFAHGVRNENEKERRGAVCRNLYQGAVSPVIDKLQCEQLKDRDKDLGVICLKRQITS